MLERGKMTYVLANVSGDVDFDHEVSRVLSRLFCDNEDTVNDTLLRRLRRYTRRFQLRSNSQEKTTARTERQTPRIIRLIPRRGGIYRIGNS